MRFYEDPPTTGMEVTTPWADVWLGADDWAVALDAPDPGTPHNEAREQVWDELVTILLDKHEDEEDVDADLLRASLVHDEELQATFNRAWPLIDATDLVGDLWSVPAYLRMCAPWLEPEEVRLLQRADPQAWTLSDLPLLDAARQRLGDPDAPRRARQRRAAAAAEREQVAAVIDDLIAADDDGEGVVTMLRHPDIRTNLADEDVVPRTDPDLLAGPFAHIVVDEAQELTDAEWQMLLLRCPSRSLTIVGDRAQARHGFTESWQERLERVGLDRVTMASLGINYRTPAEVMAEAEPVIRAVLPDANVPTSIRSTGIPIVHGPASDLRSTVDTWLGAHAEGIACVIGDPTFPATSPRPVAVPGAGEGARVRPRRPRRPGVLRRGRHGSGRPLRRDDPRDPAARHPDEPLTPTHRLRTPDRSGRAASARDRGPRPAVVGQPVVPVVL